MEVLFQKQKINGKYCTFYFGEEEWKSDWSALFDYCMFYCQITADFVPLHPILQKSAGKW